MTEFMLLGTMIASLLLFGGYVAALLSALSGEWPDA
jgi:cytochrome c oxidase assembly factor CtaG